MTELHAAPAARVEGWRAGGYAHDRYPAIAEILRYRMVFADAQVPANDIQAVGAYLTK